MLFHKPDRRYKLKLTGAARVAFKKLMRCKNTATIIKTFLMQREKDNSESSGLGKVQHVLKFPIADNLCEI